MGAKLLIFSNGNKDLGELDREGPLIFEGKSHVLKFGLISELGKWQ